MLLGIYKKPYFQFIKILSLYIFLNSFSLLFFRDKLLGFLFSSVIITFYFVVFKNKFVMFLNSFNSLKNPILTIFFSLFITSTLDFIIMDSHNTFVWNTISVFPAVLRDINPEYLQNDFLTNSSINSPKIFFIKLLSFCKFLNVDWYSYAYTLYSFICLYYRSIIFLAISSVLTYLNNDFKNSKIHKNYIHLIVFCCILSDLTDYQGRFFGWDSITLIISELDSHSVSSIFGFFLLWVFFSSQNFRLLKSGGFLFLSLIFQPAIGVFFMINILVYTFSKGVRKDIIEGFFLWSLLLVYILIIKNYFKSNIEISSEDFIETYINLRHPHHYKLSYIFNPYNMFSMVYFYLFLHTLLFIISIYTKNKTAIRLALIILLLYILIPCSQYFGTEFFKLKIIAELGPLRYSIFTAFNLALIFITMFYNFKQKIYHFEE